MTELSKTKLNELMTVFTRIEDEVLNDNSFDAFSEFRTIPKWTKDIQEHSTKNQYIQSYISGMVKAIRGRQRNEQLEAFNKIKHDVLTLLEEEKDGI